MNRRDDRLTFERSVPGRRGLGVPAPGVPEQEPLPGELRRAAPPGLPELSQAEVVRYYVGLGRLNYSIETGMYPLGSCTMKYNPKANDEVAGLSGFAGAHPLQPDELSQGVLEALWELQEALKALTGMAEATLCPAAGAQGELTGMLMVRAWHRGRGEDERRRKVLVPDSAHGTNPATAAMCGYQVVAVPTDPAGNMDMDGLRAALGDDVAGLMLTLPNTLGLWEQHILEIADAVHGAGALLYGDGANFNAIAGHVRPGDLGFDAMHVNVHKTFSTPHGGGGPGAGPVCCAAALAPFLPDPHIERRDGRLVRVRPERSIGRVGPGPGSVGVLLRAAAYLRTLGLDGIREMSAAAVLNANYLRVRLAATYDQPYDRPCMHEAVFSARALRRQGVRALDVAKRLIDYGFHPPTMYFPLIVEEALMIEPTESETKESLDAFAKAMHAIADEAATEPELLHDAPHDAPVGRLDEALAARRPVLRWTPEQSVVPAG